MSKKTSIGTTPDAIAAAEQALGRALPASYVQWLLVNNGRALGALSVFPVYDAANARKTWESIERHYRTDWQEWLENVDGGDALLPFAQFGTGDYYCFDYAQTGPSGEPVVVLWSHETGAASMVAPDFASFLILPGRPG
ncbi:SMI1/KNR4 family protein [Janthinobacterium sp. GW460P]|uniref:SMI1/KNR4 family protein n=1 Tax=unclassified Janthinobacterium TaxID=2610881 RepID=UPI000A32584E|nr:MULTISPECIES: SMI1/KNR4 family protein [unclassified Janthinobacterium]MCC7703107.1 SMI1/KNR4 family protein [Janthinobacterium sp. GW460P]MCC7708614.1 SMI1/KNR4 family protein [Janthinobacterium sp. GW460W]